MSIYQVFYYFFGQRDGMYKVWSYGGCKEVGHSLPTEEQQVGGGLMFIFLTRLSISNHGEKLYVTSGIEGSSACRTGAALTTAPWDLVKQAYYRNNQYYLTLWGFPPPLLTPGVAYFVLNKFPFNSSDDLVTQIFFSFPVVFLEWKCNF